MSMISSFIEIVCLSRCFHLMDLGAQKEMASGGIMEFSLATKQFVQFHFPKTIHHPHSVRLHEGKLLYCSSYLGEVKHGDEVV